MSKGVFFIQVMLMDEKLNEEAMSAKVVRALEAVGQEPSMIRTETVLKRARFDEIETQLKGGD